MTSDATDVSAHQLGERLRGSAVLDVRRLTVYHGQLRALSGVELAVEAGQVYAIIGANGAGKSTLLRTLAGLCRPAEGRVLLDGVDITGERAERRVEMGIALVPEGRRLFRSLTVEENLLVGRQKRRGGDWSLERVYATFDWMAGRRSQRAYQLSGGEQQAVAIGRALIGNPRILLLDELSLGLAPVVVRRIYEILPELLRSGVSVLLVEQDVGQAVRVATRIQCLLEGRSTLEGPPRQFSPSEIEAAYFGLGRAREEAGDEIGPGEGHRGGDEPP